MTKKCSPLIARILGFDSRYHVGTKNALTRMIHQVSHLCFLHSMKVRTDLISEMRNAITDDNRRGIMKVIRVSGSFFYPLVHLLGAIIGFNR